MQLKRGRCRVEALASVLDAQSRRDVGVPRLNQARCGWGCSSWVDSFAASNDAANQSQFSRQPLRPVSTSVVKEPLGEDLVCLLVGRAHATVCRVSGRFNVPLRWGLVTREICV
jgi:hypothetical protein